MKWIYRNGIFCNVLWWGVTLSAAENSPPRVMLVSPAVIFEANIREQVEILTRDLVGEPDKEKWAQQTFFDFLNRISARTDTSPGVLIPDLLSDLLCGKITPEDFEKFAVKKMQEDSRLSGTEKLVVGAAIAVCADPQKQADVTVVRRETVCALERWGKEKGIARLRVAGNGIAGWAAEVLRRNKLSCFGEYPKAGDLLSSKMGALCPSEAFFDKVAQALEVSRPALFFVGTKPDEQQACESLHIPHCIVDPNSPCEQWGL